MRTLARRGASSTETLSMSLWCRWRARFLPRSCPWTAWILSTTAATFPRSRWTQKTRWKISQKKGAAEWLRTRTTASFTPTLSSAASTAAITWRSCPLPQIQIRGQTASPSLCKTRQKISTLQYTDRLRPSTLLRYMRTSGKIWSFLSLMFWKKIPIPGLLIPPTRASTGSEGICANKWPKSRDSKRKTES